jgi:hypothetical protein
VNLALKVDVDTYRGTREGVPRLVEILARHGAAATFLFSLGPDHGPRDPPRVPARLRDEGRAHVGAEHYGPHAAVRHRAAVFDIAVRCDAAPVRDAGLRRHVTRNHGVAGPRRRRRRALTERPGRAARFADIFGERRECTARPAGR